MNILITGGAGYIGSHVVKQLLETTEHDIIVIDNLSTGKSSTLDVLNKIRDFEFINIDLNEFDEVNKIIASKDIYIILHFAASIVVPESVENPLKYYSNNTVNTTNLIKCAIENKIKRFIFSSTAAVYGEPKNLPIMGIDENYPTNPINPYGQSKLMSEKILQDTAIAYNDFKYVIFRYFNVAGADINYNNGILSPRIGQSFPNATHLIKIASECASKKRNKMYIFGTDFDTQDGSGVRDYIHVDDLADAHVKAIDYLENNPSDIFNVGYGKGYSVKEVVKTMKEVTGIDFIVENSLSRLGDPGLLVSDNIKIKAKMKWKPKYENLELICRSAFEWENKLCTK